MRRDLHRPAGPERAKRVFGAAGEAGHHLIGIDTNALQLGDELTNNFRVRHPAPDWGWRRRRYVWQLLGGEIVRRRGGQRGQTPSIAR